MVSPYEVALGASAGVGRTGVHRNLRPDIQAFLANLESRPELEPLSIHVFSLMLGAFAARDSHFPHPSCATILGAPPIPHASMPDDFAQNALTLVRDGAVGPVKAELFGIWGLLEFARHQSSAAETAAQCARPLLWLECNSQLPVLTIAANILDLNLLEALANNLSRLLDESNSEIVDPPLSRGEKYAALAWLQSLDASIQKLTRPVIVPPIPIPGGQFQCPQPPTWVDTALTPLTGRLATIPSGSARTAISAFTGWLLVRQVWSWMVRIVFAYRTFAEIRLTEKGLEVREHKSLLGRQFREKTSLIALRNVRHLTREIRYARSGTYAGLAALAMGSFLGMRLFVDGLRVPGMSGSLLWLGLAVVVGGLSLDFLLVNWLDAKRGQCRFVIIADRGPGLCLTGVESARVDAVLSALAEKLRN
jgi:hypothetical protein